MFGFLRLLLAACVLLSHLGLRVAGFNPGVAAVVVFLLLSGHATHHLVTACRGSAARYHADRLLRIFPPYLAAVALAAACWLALDPHKAYLSKPPDALDWLANLTVFPLNAYRWAEREQFTIIPQAWSLALELQFYAAVPFLAARSQRVLATLVGASAAVWLLSCFQAIDSDVWGYRLLPGTLFLFLTGLCIARRLAAPLLVAAAAMAAAAASLLTGAAAPADFNVECCAGFFLGAALVAALAPCRATAADNKAGALSYPLFLSHFSVLWTFEALGYPEGGILQRPVLLSAVLAASLAVSWAIYAAVDRPLKALRRRLRQSPLPA